MKLLLDANLPRTAVAVVSLQGHDVVHAREIGLGAATDREIADLARAESRILVTRDFDFADIRNYPPADYPGIIVLDLPNNAIAPEVCHLLDGFLRSAGLSALMPGRLAIVRHGRVRFRPPLLP